MYHYKNDAEQAHFEYLDELRESGVTNMLGSPAYLARTFGMDKEKAQTIVTKWMNTFSERHGDE